MRKKNTPRRETRDTTRINEAIREREVRLIDSQGEHVGVVPVDKALQIAQESNLDLVEVSGKSKPHVCRVMDYGQFKYEQSKKQKEAKKKQKTIQVKEVKLRPRIEKHDYDFKVNNARKFLDNDDKVKFIMQFRGREMAHKDLGRDVMDRVINDLQGLAQVEQEPRQEGRFMNMILAPLPASKRKKSDDSKSNESPSDSESDTSIDKKEQASLETSSQDSPKEENVKEE